MKEKGNKGFWDRWAKRYDFVMSGDGRIYAQIVSRMKKALDRKLTVLERACGTGLLSVWPAGSERLLGAELYNDFLWDCALLLHKWSVFFPFHGA